MNQDLGNLGIISLELLARDVSPREYYRGKDQSGRSVIVMRYPDFDQKARAELQGFIRIRDWLAAKGLKVPALYWLYEDLGCAVFEDLGSTSFGQALCDGYDPEVLYTLACDVLIRLREAGPMEGLPEYTQSGIYAKRRLMVDYYLPLVRGRASGDSLAQDYLAVWDEIQASLSPCPQGFLHADYHLENIMLVEGEEGVKRCGLIDFQDALTGPLPYDLVNLLEGARVDVSDDLRTKIIDRYCVDMSLDERAMFLSWYRVLAAQFHGRVIGLFVMLAVEQRRDEYLIHISRLQNYIQKSLDDPVLAPLKRWFAKEGVDFAPINDLNGERVREVFRNQSF